MARLSLRWLVLGLLLSIAATLGRAASPFDEARAEAERLRAEDSWALAAAAYEKAATAAPAEEARQSATLAGMEMAWRAAEPVPWRDRTAFAKTWTERLAGMGTAYAGGRPRDDFWVEWQLALLEFKLNYDPQSVGTLWQDVLLHLGSQPRTAAATERLGQVLQRMDQQRENLPAELRHATKTLLVSSRTAPASASTHAWLLGELARLEEQAWSEAGEPLDQAAAVARAWQEAREAARGTEWEAPVGLQAFLWLNVHARAVQGKPLDPKDLPSLLAEGDRLMAACLPSAANEDLRQRWDHLRRQWQEPQLRVESTVQTRPGEPVRFTFGGLGLKKVALDVVRVKPEEYLEHEQTRWLGRGRLAELQGETVWSRGREWTEQENGAWSTETWSIPEGLPGGLYQLRWHAEKRTGGELETSRAELWVTRWAMQKVNAGSDIGILVTDTKTGEAASGLEVTVGWRSETSGDRLAVSTNEVGFSSVDVKSAEGQVILLGWRGQEPLAGPGRFWLFGSGEAERPVGDLLLDRPLYEPGETVNWRLLVRQGSSGEWRLPSLADSVKVEFRSDRNEVLWSGSAKWSDFGTLEGKFELASDLAPTAVSLRVFRSGSTEPWLQEYACFRVDRYEPPAVTASLALESAAETLVPGGLVQFGLKVTYFSGSPVVGAPVEFEVNPSERFQPRRERSRVAPDYLATWPTQKWRATTDQNGVARFELALPAEMEPGTTLAVSAQAVANGGTAVAANQNFFVYPKGKYIKTSGLEAMTTDRLGRSVTFEAQVRKGDGQPAVGRFEASIERLRWNEVWRDRDGRVVDGVAALAARKADPALVGWERLHAAYHAIEVVRMPAESDAKGAVRVTWTPDAEGLYQLVLWDGKQALDAERVYRYPQPFDLFPETKGEGSIEPERPLALVVGKGTQLDLPAGAAWLPQLPTAPAGDGPWEGLALLPLSDDPTWLIFNRGEGLKTLAWEKKGRVAHFKLPAPKMLSWPEEWTLALQSGTLSSTGRQQTIEVPVSYPELTVQMTPKGVARPGELSEADVQVLDREGRPVRAEVAIAVADEAVRALVGNGESEGERFPYYQPRRHPAPQIQVASRGSNGVPETIPDPRPGFGSGRLDDERLELSVFSVGSTLAGSRIQTNVGDLGRHVSIVSGQLLKDMGANSSSDLLKYTANSEVSGTYANIADESPAAARVRVNYQSTAWWASSLRTDAEGRAKVSFRWPDNLTRWHWQAVAVGAAPQAFGQTQTLTRTDLPFQARLRVPEVLIVGDRVELSGTLVNQAETAVAAKVEWAFDDSIHKMDTNEKSTTEVPAQAEATTTQAVNVVAPGTLDVTLRAAAAGESDAMRRTTSVREDGLLQKTFASLALPAGKSRVEASLPLPRPLDPTRADATVRVEPLGVGSLVEAIPYLVHYPYGCVEQTLNRFLPAVAVRGFLVQQGLPAEDVQARWMRAEGRRDGPTTQTLEAVIEGGLARLEEAMVGGGYGWWPNAPSIDPWMTSYVAWGLQEARRHGVAIDADWLGRTEDAARGVAEATEGNPNAVAWALVALAASERTDLPLDALRARWQSLFSLRTAQSPSTRALLLWSADRFGSAEAKAILLRNLENGATRTNTLGWPLCSWQGVQAWCRAEDSATETTAITLFALLAAAPRDDRVDAAAHWLLLNRRGAQWDSTRSTALAVLALQRWLETRQTEPLDEQVEVWVDGNRLAELTLTAKSLVAGPTEVAVPTKLLRAGGVSVELRRQRGQAPLVVTAAGRAWATGDGVQPFAQVLGVERVWRRQEATETLRGDLLFTPRDLASQEAVRRGEALQGRVALKTEVALQYLKVEVPLAGGTSPSALLSGWDARLVPADGPAEGGFPVYREAHAGKSVFFLPELPVGKWVLVFDLRADLGGDFRTLPAEAEAMYVPEVRGNSDSRRLRVAP